MESSTNEPATHRRLDFLFKVAAAIALIVTGLYAIKELPTYSGAVQILLLLATAILFPTALFLFGNRRFRIFIFIVATLFGIGTQTFMDLAGPDSPAGAIPWLGYCIAAGAVISETTMLLWGLCRR